MGNAAGNRTVVVIVQGVEPARLREVIEREGWQLPLAPFAANGDTVALVSALARRAARKAR